LGSAGPGRFDCLTPLRTGLRTIPTFAPGLLLAYPGLAEPLSTRESQGSARLSNLEAGERLGDDFLSFMQPTRPEDKAPQLSSHPYFHKNDAPPWPH
jgi:hypothetical protein